MNSKRMIAGISALAIVGAVCNGAFPAAMPYSTVYAADEEYESDDWFYTSVEGGIKLTKYKLSYYDQYILSVPDEIDGQKVVEISAHILDDNKYIGDIVLPSDDIRFDGNILENKRIMELSTPLMTYYRSGFCEGMALGVYSKLQGVGMYGDEYEYLHYDPDTGELLSEVQLFYPVEYYDYIDGEYVLKDMDIVIPSHIGGAEVVELYSNCFSDSRIINTVTLPDTIRFIGANCFSNSSLRSVSIPEGVRFILDGCFSGCDRLEKADLPDSIIAVCDNAFAGSALDNDSPYSSSRNIYSYYDKVYTIGGDWLIEYSMNEDFSISVCPFEYVGDDTVVDFPLEINGYPVRDSLSSSSPLFLPVSVEELRMPDGITWLPPLKNSPIRRIEIPSNVEEIRDYGFASCTELTELTIPAGVKSIGSMAFSNCVNLGNVTFEGDSIFIDAGAFKGTDISSFELPGNCTLANEIADKSLKSVKFGAGDCLKITSRAFASSTALENVEISPDIREIYIGQGAFDGTAVTRMEFGDNVRELGVGAFRNCHALEYFSLGGETAIPANAFKDDTALKEAVLNGKHDIGKGAFEGCTSLSSVSLDLDSSISYDAFRGCPELEYINGIKVLSDDGTGFAPELDEFVRSKFDGAVGAGFVDTFVLNMAEKVAAEVTDDSMSDIEKAKALHDWICENARYSDGNLSNPGNHYDASVFMDGVAVCEGYSRTYNLLLHAAGINSWFVGNYSHSWNIAELDGKTFHIDTTWDDTESSYNWFLLSDKQLRSAGGDHEDWFLSLPSELHSFQTDTMPECVDVIGDMDGDGDLDTADLSALREKLFTGGKYDIKADLDYNGKLSAGDLSAAIRRIGSRLIMGDVDGDGLVTSADASKLLDEYALMSVSDGMTFDDRMIIVSDVNVDGQINAADASSILGYYTYISTGGDGDICKYTEN